MENVHQKLSTGIKQYLKISIGGFKMNQKTNVEKITRTSANEQTDKGTYNQNLSTVQTTSLSGNKNNNKGKIGIICAICIVCMAVIAGLLFAFRGGSNNSKNIIKNIDNATALHFYEGMAAVEQNGKIGFIDLNGNIVIEPQFDAGYGPVRFSEDVAIVSKDGYSDGTYFYSKFGVIDKNGNTVVPFGKYDGIGDACSEGLIYVRQGELLGYIDKTGKEVIPCKYNAANPFSEGIAIVTDNNYNSLKAIDKTGKELFEVTKYKNIGDFHDEFARVQDKDSELWGYIDKTGNEVIPCIYYNSADFSEELAAVCVDGGWRYIDKSGETVIDTKYYRAYEFKNGCAEVEKPGGFENDNGNMYDYINKKGESILPDGYEVSMESEFEDGLAPVNLLNGKTISRYINSRGDFVLQEYKSANSFEGGVARVSVVNDRSKDTMEYIDTEGNVLFTVQQGEEGKYDLIIASHEAK